MTNEIISPPIFTKRFRLEPGKSILDCGCGHGYILQKYGPACMPDGKLAGFDCEETLLEKARTNLKESGLEANLYKGNIYFEGLADCPASLYNPADASMEALDGLNPVSSQGYVEVQAVEAWAIARAGQTKDNPDDFDGF